MRHFAFAVTVLLCLIAAMGSLGPENTPIYRSRLFLILWAAFFVSMAVCTLKLMRSGRKKIYKCGVAVVHAGFMIVLLGAAGNMLSGFSGKVYLLEGMQQSHVIVNDKEVKLDLSIRCDDFSVEYYEGMPKAKSYTTKLAITDGNSAVNAVIDVNRPFTYKGITFYQHDFGLEPSAEIRFSYSVNGRDYSAGLDETVEAEAHRVTVVDFTPSLGVSPDGKFYTFNSEQPMNPAGLFEISDGETTVRQWLVSGSGASRFLKDGVTVSFLDYSGVEYSVLGVSKAPYDPLFYFGFLLMSAGLSAIYCPRKEKKNEY